MVKQVLSLATVAGLLIAGSSCKTAKKSSSAQSDFDYTFVSKQGIYQKPLISDLQVGSQRVTIKQTYTNLSFKEAKENAMGDFIKQQKCDLIVQPFSSCTSETLNEVTTVNITLSGYPATFKNIRNFQLQDINLFPKGTIDLSNGGTSTGATETKGVGGLLKGFLKHK